LDFTDRQADLKVFREVFLKGTTADLPNGLGAFAVAVRRDLPDGTEAVTVYLAREGELTVASDEVESGG
jgi:hypothetical protein